VPASKGVLFPSLINYGRDLLQWCISRLLVANGQKRQVKYCSLKYLLGLHGVSLPHSICSKTSASLFTILFVYLAKRLPTYFVDNLNSTKSRFPENDLVLVTDAILDPRLSRSISILHPDKLDWKSSRPELLRDMRFWDGWWQKTFDRLLMIRPVHELYPDSSLVQVEADTVLFPSFAKSSILKQKKISYPMYSDRMAVASLIFSSSIENSRLLEQALLEELLANQGTSDMDALGSIAKKLGESFLQLPEFPYQNSNFVNDGPNGLLELGLFDGASHGEWICGRDPKAHWGLGRRKMRTPISENLEMPEYQFENSQLTCTINSIIVPIHNLHVHSKELPFFRKGGEDDVRNLISRANSAKGSHRFFQFSAFLFCLQSKVKIWSSSFFSRRAWMRLVSRIVR
jgi:hypothetical protein